MAHISVCLHIRRRKIISPDDIRVWKVVVWLFHAVFKPFWWNTPSHPFLPAAPKPDIRCRFLLPAPPCWFQLQPFGHMGDGIRLTDGLSLANLKGLVLFCMLQKSPHPWNPRRGTALTARSTASETMFFARHLIGELLPQSLYACSCRIPFIAIRHCRCFSKSRPRRTAKNKTFPPVTFHFSAIIIHYPVFCRKILERRIIFTGTNFENRRRSILSKQNIL